MSCSIEEKVFSLLFLCYLFVVFKTVTSSSNSPQDIANIFANFFESILKKFIFISISSCFDYTHNHFQSNTTLSSYRNVTKFIFHPVDEEDLKKILNGIDPNLAAGISGIESDNIKHSVDEMIKLLTLLFNLCISTNVIPDEWKVSFVTPVLKPKSPKSSLDSYRPISVITPIAKVFEMIIEQQIRTYLEANSMLHDAQFGFRKGRSCELAINTIVDSWKFSLDLKKLIIALFLDLS